MRTMTLPLIKNCLTKACYKFFYFKFYFKLAMRGLSKKNQFMDLCPISDIL